MVYVGNESRNEALLIIKKNLDDITENITSKLSSIVVHKSYQEKHDALRLIVTRNGVSVKIELSPVLRGTVFPVENRVVNEVVENEFGFVEAPIVSLPDLYGGKICAALDRQHPRDLYDVKLLLENEGLTDDIRKATLVYMISHPRPIAELLNPYFKDIEKVFMSDFSGMTIETIEFNELVIIREKMVRLLQSSLTEDEKLFLLSFKNRNPKWELLGLEDAKKLPAVRWKQLNLEKMSSDKYQAAYNSLKEIIDSLK